MLEQPLRRLFKQARRVHALLRERAGEVKRLAQGRWRLVACEWTIRNGGQQLRQLVHKAAAQRAEGIGVHGECGVTVGIGRHH